MTLPQCQPGPTWPAPVQRTTPVVPVPSAGVKQHVLTIALEDYFQVGAFNRLIQSGRWYRFEPRLEHNTLRTLDLLDQHNIKATFFILGWIADQFPEVVRAVAERGHEIGSKGYYHRSIRQMTPSEFGEDLARSREALERAGRTKVLGYRVAHEWFRPSDLWALDVLAREGYAYDSSVGPLLRRFAHEPWRRFLHKHEAGDSSLWEFPLSSLCLLGWSIPIAGGNYFRQFPHWLVRRAVDRWHRKYDAPFVMYFHVWELDPEQPKISGTSLLTRIRHYRNLGKMPRILESYFRKYRFTSIANYLGLSTALEENQLSPAAAKPRLLGAGERRFNLVGLPRPAAGEADGDEPASRTPVSVVVPCYNEEKTLTYLSNTLKSVQEALSPAYDLHFVFVDDCSKDRTCAGLRQTFGPWPNCTVVRHEQNQGVAGAILTGIRHAPTEVVCSMDCDCTYDPHDLGHMIPLLKEGVDMVTASPYHPEGHVLNVRGWRLWLSKSASFLYRRVIRQKLSTYTSCFRVYRRSAMLDLGVRESSYLGIPEMLARLDMKGSRIVEYPATLESRVLGQSKMKVLRTIFGHLRLITRLKLMRWFRLGAGRPAPPPPPVTVYTREPGSAERSALSASR